MYRSLINFFPFVLLFAVFSSCGFADLRPIGFSTIPEQPYAILPHENSSVVLKFDTDMMEKEVEGVMQIISPSGTVDGDFVWKGRELHFVPASSWAKGIRYVLKISGTVYSRDGRDMVISQELPFYAVAAIPLPYLVSSYPDDGASTEAFLPGDLMLRLRFSLPMDRVSVEAALNCDGVDQSYFHNDRELYFQWSDDDSVLSVRTKEPLLAWTVYRWSVSEKAMSRDGAPLAKAVSGRFITDKDDVFPQVVKVVPMIRGEVDSLPWGSWVCNGTDLKNGIGHGQAIGVEFNKAMDTEKLKSSFSFEPSLPGRLEIVSPHNAIYIPDKNPEPETHYTMKISGDVRDVRGLKMGEDLMVYFSSDIPFLSVFSLTFDNAPDLGIIEYGKIEAFTVEINEADSGVARFDIRFSLSITIDAQREITPRITLSPFFPNNLGSVNLRFVHWIAPHILRMEWEGLQSSKSEEPHYYKLTLPGGRNGISNGEGSYLKEETYFIFEAVKK
jgi:hypothetical protein